MLKGHCESTKRPRGRKERTTNLRAVSKEPTFARNPDVVFRSIEGGAVLLNTRSGSYHEVNSTAREIWVALEGPTTEEDLVDRLAQRHKDVPDLRTDVREFLAQLVERDLVVPS